ncbi:uncharacterized protein LOC136025899 isoform X2 [Artemia franciscana]|uniref:Max-binding protein MNT n=1 Tax=Artemia franciscana TaxID=6661 RepID=A0AA88HF89_ARTSF|nr:hypothetical protein QYM36_012211 [Artemia franciscana]
MSLNTLIEAARYLEYCVTDDGSESCKEIVYTTEVCEAENLSDRRNKIEFMTVPAPPYIVSEITVEESTPLESSMRTVQPQSSTPSPSNMVYVETSREDNQNCFAPNESRSHQSPVYTEIGQYGKPQGTYYVLESQKCAQKFNFLPTVKPKIIESSGDYRQLDCFDNKPRRTSSTTRETHNKLEKNRRAHMRECFEVLRRQLPDTEDKRLSNLGILKMACRSIQLLKRKERELEHSIELLARDKIANQQRLEALKKEVPEYEIVDSTPSISFDEMIEVKSESSPSDQIFGDPWRTLGVYFEQKDLYLEDDRESRTTATASERGDSDPEDINVQSYNLDNQNQLRTNQPQEKRVPIVLSNYHSSSTRESSECVVREPFEVAECGSRLEYVPQISHPGFTSIAGKANGISSAQVLTTGATTQVSVIRGVGVRESVGSLGLHDRPLNLTSQKKKLDNSKQVEQSSFIIQPRPRPVQPSSSSTGTPVMTRYGSHGSVILANPIMNKR